MEIDLEKWGDKLCWLVGVPLVALLGYFIWGMVLRPQRITVVLPTPPAASGEHRGVAVSATPVPTAAPTDSRVVSATVTVEATRPATATPEAAATPTIEANASGVSDVVFEGHSTKWVWNASASSRCKSSVVEWLEKHDWAMKVKRLEVVLVDDKAEEDLRPGPKGEERKLAIGVGWPGARNYTALAYSGCVVDEGDARCYVAPAEGSGEGLDAAVSVAWAYALEDYFRPKTMQAWEEMSKNWSWSNYSPLVHEEGGKWLSSCLGVEKAK